MRYLINEKYMDAINQKAVIGQRPEGFRGEHLAALWAFSECALGGVMHAFKLPFTAVFVGGFAILCIGLLAHFGDRRPSVILRALVLVLAAKALVSPHSPPTAYLAVAFQGLSGALLLCYVRPVGLAAVLFGALAMAESAIQKILVMLLFFGKPLVEAIDLFIEEVLKIFGLAPAVSGAVVIAGVYVLGYTLWGVVLGRWIVRLPQQLEARRAYWSDLENGKESFVAPPPRKNWAGKLAGLFGVLAFVAVVFLLFGGKVTGAQRALFAVLRTVAALLGWFFIVNPAIQWMIRRWAHRKAGEGELPQLLAAFPDIRWRAGAVYRRVSAQYKGWRRWKEFVLGLIKID